jgi:hypothetical protein
VISNVPGAAQRREWIVPGLADIEPNVQVTSIRQIDLLEGVLAPHSNDPRSRPYYLPPYVVGSCARECVDRHVVFHTLDRTKPNEAIWDLNFQIDNDRKLIIFDRYVYIDGGVYLLPGLVEAELALVTSCHIRNADGGHIRYRKESLIDPNIQTPPLVIVKDEIELAKFCQFDREDWSPKQQLDNRPNCDVVANYYIDAAKEKFETKESGTRVYPGLVAVEPDGAIREVTWSVGGGSPTTTTVSRNTEHAYWQPSYEFNRNQIITKFMIDLGRDDRA